MKLNKKGFTLIELLGTIVIIGLIIAGTAYGLIKLIYRSKEEKANISISSIEKAASAYANEKNNDESYWKEMTIEDIKGKYFCVTIEVLMNKGLLDKNIDLSDLDKNKNITKTTYVGIKKDDTSKVNSNPTLLNDAEICNLSSNDCSKKDILYGVCTGNILNEEIASPPAILGGKSYTDAIYNIEFTDIKAKEGTTIEIDKKYCYYSKEQSSLGNGTPKEAEDTQNSSGNNICNISGLEDDTTYYVRACITTKGGSTSCSETKEIKTEKVQTPSFSLNNILIINYNTTGIRDNTASYYFTSNTNATSSVSVQECDNNSSGSTTEIEGGKTYKSPIKEINLTYTDSGKPTVKAKTCDETGNCAEIEKPFNIFKTSFIKNNADKIGGGTSNITKMCLTEGSTCNITSPSIERAGYTVVGWNTDISATSSEWAVGASKNINSNGTYYPITKQSTFYIHYDDNGGSGCSGRTTTVTKGAKVGSLCTSRRSGYWSFSGWYYNGTRFTSRTIYNYDYDITLKASWYYDEPEPDWSCTITGNPACRSCASTSCNDVLGSYSMTGDGVEIGSRSGSWTKITASSSGYSNCWVSDYNGSPPYSCSGGSSTTTPTPTPEPDPDPPQNPTKTCPSGYEEYSSVQCRKKVGTATCAATCRTYDTNKTKCQSYSTYCNWNGAGRGACPPKTQYEGKCLSYKCTTGTLSGTNCYLYANKS